MVVDGRRPGHIERGFYVAPTLLAECKPSMTPVREEIFGPVVVVRPVRRRRRRRSPSPTAPTSASTTTCSLPTPSAASALAGRLRIGNVGINTAQRNMEAPFGGFKLSGVGRDGGDFGLHAYTEMQSVVWPVSDVNSLAGMLDGRAGDRVLAARAGRDHVGHLADLGAEVIKVEPPAGDYVRQMTWPIVDGISLLHLHINRGKQSLVLDLKTPEAIAVFVELVRDVRRRRSRRMRPGFLDKPGLGYDRLQGAQPADRVLHDLRATARPARTAPAEPRHRLRRVGRHAPARRRRRRLLPASPTTPTSASTPGPRSARSAILAALIRARDDRRGRVHGDRAVRRRRVLRLVPHRDLEGLRRAPRGRGHRQRERRLRAPRPGPRRACGRACATSSTSRPTATSCSWRRSRRSGRTSARASAAWTCSRSGRARRIADHARGNTRAAGRAARHLPHPHHRRSGSTFADEHNTPIAPVNTPQTIADDPQFQDRFDVDAVRAARAPTSCRSRCKSRARSCRCRRRRPTVGEHTDEVLRDVLGYDDAKDRRAPRGRRPRLSP